MTRRLLLTFALALGLTVPAFGQAVIVPSPIPALTNNCVLKWQTGTTTWICAEASAASQPLTDALALIADDADSTKILAFQVSGITTGTTRTWTIPDANLTVPSTIASLGANTFTGLQTLNAGLAATSGTFSSTLAVTGATTLTGGVTGAMAATGAVSGTSGTFTTTLNVTGAISSGASVALTGTTNNLGTITTGVWNAGAVTSSGDVTVLAGGTVRSWGGTMYTSSSATPATGNITLIGHDGTTGYVATSYLAGGAYTALGFKTNNIYRAVINVSGTQTWAPYGAGTATFDASGNITSVSDERLKDIQGPYTPGLNALLGLRPILFHYNEASGLDTENLYAGFSAQNVLAYLPEAVGKNLDGVFSVNLVPLLAATVTAVQELTAELDALRAKAGLLAKDRTVAAVTTEDRVMSSAKAKILPVLRRIAALPLEERQALEAVLGVSFSTLQGWTAEKVITRVRLLTVPQCQALTAAAGRDLPCSTTIQ